MDYPFPGPRTSIVVEWLVVVALVILAFVPIARALGRRKVQQRSEGLWGLFGGLLAPGIARFFPHVQAGLPNPRAGIVDLFAWMVALIQFGWCLTVINIRRNAPNPGESSAAQAAATFRNRIQEVALSYGLGIGLLPACCLYHVLFTHPHDYMGDAFDRARCRNNLKHIGLAMHNDSGTDGILPSLAEKPGQPDRSWRVDLLPYLDQSPLRHTYVDSAQWNDPPNLPIASRSVDTYQCPTHGRRLPRHGMWRTSYAAVRGPNTAFPDGRGLSLRDITDGVGNTVLIVEACGQPIVWSEPRDLDLAANPVGINLPGDRPNESRGVFSSYHRSGVYALLADGSVRFVPDTTDTKVLTALLTATGGEDLSPEKW